MLKPFYQELLVEAGCDEAGRGCLAGPVFAAAVILPKDFYHPLLNDSKQLSLKQRVLLRPIIEQNAIDYAVSMVSNQEIDKLNILRASITAMHRAVDSLTKAKPELLIIDGNRFYPYQGINHVCIVKGDSKFTSIAAASVLAKTYRDDFMLEQSHVYKGYGWERNMGYPTKEHRQAIEKHGTTPLHRLTFRLTKNDAKLL
ncbi:MAG: ribonuclease HII [Tenuifilaceae bacterium]|jgi:ribonuclease HII|nr:ribonuclease HII [Tenuifilaceae bacterium]